MTYHPAIIAAMKLASKKMDCYYSLTDSLPIYRITMVLHPGMKLEYFHNHEWEAEWIGEVERLVRTKYVEQYEQQADEAPTTPSTSSITHHNSGFASFGDLSVTTAPRVSEIQEYLSHPVENVKDPLRWWVDNKTVYPRLHRMALEYLSVPGKSGIHCNSNNTNNNTDTLPSNFHRR